MTMDEEGLHKCLNIFIGITQISDLFKKRGHTEKELLEEIKGLSEDTRNLVLMKFRMESDEKIKKIIHDQVSKEKSE